jgi:hypothetical protein
LSDPDDKLTAPANRATSEKNRATGDKLGTAKARGDKPTAGTKPATPPPVPKTVVLNLVGVFANPWHGDPAAEKQHATKDAIQRGKTLWHPSTEDWEAVFHRGNPTVTPTTVESFSQFLGIIQQQGKAAISRINIFSHGNEGLIAFSGSIDPSNGEVTLNTRTGLDERTITSTEPISGKDKKGIPILTDSPGGTARRLRDRFANGAQIVFFLCNSARGISLPLLQEVANAFQVTVKGSATEVLTGIQFDQTKNSLIERGFTCTGAPTWESCPDKKPGFAHLEASLRTAQPKADR